MIHALSHIKTCTFRRFSGFFLTVIYGLIALAPLAPVPLHSKTVLHAVTGECVGDCTVCGCSPEARVNGTCCCAQKHKLQQDRTTTVTGSCCVPNSAPPAPSTAATNKSSCCSGKNGEQVHDGHETHGHSPDNRTVTLLKCGCPCGSGKQFALSGVSFEYIPAAASIITAPYEYITAYVIIPHRAPYRHGEPPTPPPELSQIS